MAASTTLSLSFPEPDIAVLTLDDPRLERERVFAPRARIARRTSRRAGRAQRSRRAGDSLGQAGHVHRRRRPEGIRRLARRAEERSQRLLPRQGNSSLAGWRSAIMSPWPPSTASASAAARNWPCGATAAIFYDNEKTAFGFPEVKLGLFPGWGGTARTPRMVGLRTPWSW